MKRMFKLVSGPYKDDVLEMDVFDDHGEIRLFQPKNDCGYYWAEYGEVVEVSN